MSESMYRKIHSQLRRRERGGNGRIVQIEYNSVHRDTEMIGRQ